MTGDTPRLTTARLLLTLPVAGDAPKMLRYAERNREHLAPWSPPERPGARTLDGALRRIETLHQEYRAGTAVRFWLRSVADPNGAYLGAVSLSQIFLGPFRACYLGYQLDFASVGQGLMHEALTQVITYAFEDLELHRIMANYLPKNERSGRLLRKLGFAVEGYARDYLYIDGQFRDHVLTSLTNYALSDLPPSA